MKKLLLTLLFLASLAVPAAAQTCPTRPLNDNSNSCASTAFVTNALSGFSPGGVALTNSHVLVGNASNVATDVALSGDCGMAVTGAITCTKTNGVSFGPLATSSLVTPAQGGFGADFSGAAANTIPVFPGSGGNAAPTTTSTLFDAACSSTVGQIWIRMTGGWGCSSLVGYTNPIWFGAKCDGTYNASHAQNFIYAGTTLSITSGSPNLTSTGSTFTSADVGKSIYVPGAGVAGAGLSTTIAAFVDATHITLTANASTTLSAFSPLITAPFVYGTDDTTAIQNAMNATPVGGALYIPSQPTTGCLIKKQGSNNYALHQDHPFNIRGNGHFSTLMTDPSIASTVDDILVDVGVYDWANITWENFSLGDIPSFLPQTLLMYPRHGKRGLALVDTSSVGFIGVTIQNLTVGESSNDYSVYLGNPSAAGGSQFNTIQRNKIWGGLKLDSIADSFRVLYNTLQGSSTFGGVFNPVAGAGMFLFTGNNVTWAGGFQINGFTKPVINYNYFEELFATSEANNAMVDFNGSLFTVTMPSFVGNIVNADVSNTSTPVRYGNAVNGNFGDNWMATKTVRTGVTSTTTLNCTAPNSWNGVGTHFSTALANSYAGC